MRATVKAAAGLGTVLLAAQCARAAPTVVISSADTFNGQNSSLSDVSQIVIDDNNNIATLGMFNERAVTLSLSSMTGYSNSIIATESDFGRFENLGLTTSGATSTVVFAAPSGNSTQAGIYSSTNGTTPQATFFGDQNTPNQQTLNTAGQSIPPIAYGLSKNANVSFGTRSGTNGNYTQSLHLNDPQNPLNTAGVSNFNMESAPEYRVKTVALSGSVVAVAKDSAYGVYDFTQSSLPNIRYGPITDGGQSYDPRQLIGATATQSVVVAQNHNNQSDGGVFYQNGGNIIAIASSINPGNSAGELGRVVGEMTTLGKTAVFVPSIGVVYYDPATGQTSTLGSGSPSGGGPNIVNFSPGTEGFEPMPMVNDNGWVVIGANVQAGAGSNAALIAWNPALAASKIIAQVGDTFTQNGNTYQIINFTNTARNSDFDVLKDALNESDVVAFGVAYENVSDSTDTGVAIMSDTVSSPEPVTVALGGLGAMVLLTRRGRRTPH